MKLAEVIATGQRVAIKVSNKRLMYARETRKGNKVMEDPVEENRVLRMLNKPPPSGHPGAEFVLTLVDEAEDEHDHWTVMPYMNGDLFEIWSTAPTPALTTRWLGGTSLRPTM